MFTRNETNETVADLNLNFKGEPPRLSTREELFLIDNKNNKEKNRFKKKNFASQSNINEPLISANVEKAAAAVSKTIHTNVRSGGGLYH